MSNHEVVEGETSTKETRSETNGVLVLGLETPFQSSTTQQYSDASPQTSLFSFRNVVCMSSSSVYGSIKTVVFSNKLNFLMPFGAVAIVVHKWTDQTAWVFILSLLGIIPLAERLGYTTEQLSFYSSQTVGGLLNATFGNATELIIASFALKHGKTRLVQLSMLGSILSNLFFVLGCAFLSGGLFGQRKEQAFTKATAVVDSGVLLMGVMSILLPAVLHYTNAALHPGKSELSLSRFSSCVMLVAYAAYIFNQIKSQRDRSPVVSVDDEEQQLDGNNVNDEEEVEVPQISIWEGLVWLAIVTAGISVLSDYLVDAMEGASNAWNMSMSFVSVILPPIASNAAALTSSVMFAVKDKLDMSLGVAIGSSTQIAMFVLPFCVLVGWMIDCPMDLNFQPFETASLFITVTIVVYFLQDGTSNYLKGLMLILCYLIMAASFFVHDDPSSGDGN